MKGLTVQQARVFAFLCTFIEVKGYPPTYKEIRAAFGWTSNNAVRDVLERLEAKGVIRVEPLLSRGISLMPAHRPGPGVSARGHRFVFVEPMRAYRGAPVIFPPTPIVFSPGGPS